MNLQVTNLSLDSDIISPSYSTKNLGVLLQSDKSLDSHILSIIKFCFMQLCDFRHIRPLIYKIAAITLGNSFIHSRLNYCNSLFYFMVYLITPFIVCKKFKIQLLALSLIVTVYHTPLQFLNFLHRLLVNCRINFKICCITHRALSLHEPHYLSSLLSLRLNSHSLCSSSFSPLLLPYFNKKSHGFCSFSYAAPHLWNHIPNNVRTAPTYIFKKKLKTHLFNQAFST